MSQQLDRQWAGLLRGLAQNLEGGRDLEGLDRAQLLQAARGAAQRLDPVPETPAPQAQSATPAKTPPGGAPVVLHTDGAARGNPGPAGAGAVLLDAQGQELARRVLYLGETTNNVAEYQALILGLELAREMGVGPLIARLDSELVVKQLNGQYQVKHPALKPLHQKVRGLAQELGGVKFQHVRREYNRMADELANLAIDQR